MKPIYYGALLVLAMFLNSCSKSESSTPASNNNGGASGSGLSSSNVSYVYVAGDSLVNGNSYPVIWKNGVMSRLPTGNYSFGHANSIFVSGANVYVAGYISNGSNTLAAIWRNGILYNLSNCPNGEAKSVYVAGSDVYIAGFIDTAVLGSIAIPRAILWKNNSPTLIWPSYWESKANSVFISPSTLYPGTNDVYVTGIGRNSNIPYFAFLVKNGVPLYGGGVAPDLYSNLGSDTKSNSVFVSGSDIYMTGFYASGSGFYNLVWKNGTEIQRIGGNSVFVSGSDIYVSGGGLFKNGVAQNLTNLTGGGSGVGSIYVLGNDVYACGGTFGSTVIVPVYWKNGNAIPLTNDHNGFAHSIFVTP